MNASFNELFLEQWTFSPDMSLLFTMFADKQRTADSSVSPVLTQLADKRALSAGMIIGITEYTTCRIHLLTSIFLRDYFSGCISQDLVILQDTS